MENPYQTMNENSGASSLGGGVFQSGGHANGLEASGIAQSALFSSKGWVRFISVLAFIYFAVMVIAVFAMMATLGRMGGGAGLLVMLLVVVMTVVVFMLALRLSKFASSIGRMEMSRNPGDLENAMVEQMKFWRLAGIMVLIGLVFMLLTLVTAIV